MTLQLLNERFGYGHLCTETPSIYPRMYYSQHTRFLTWLYPVYRTRILVSKMNRHMYAYFSGVQEKLLRSRIDPEYIANIFNVPIKLSIKKCNNVMTFFILREKKINLIQYQLIIYKRLRIFTANRYCKITSFNSVYSKKYYRALRHQSRNQVNVDFLQAKHYQIYNMLIITINTMTIHVH